MNVWKPSLIENFYLYPWSSMHILSKFTLLLHCQMQCTYSLTACHTQKYFALKIFPGIPQIDLVVGEPYFQSAVLPWHHVHFWYAARQLSGFLSETAEVFPQLLTIKAMAVSFRDLWKIRSPVGMCEGFNIQLFDQLIEVHTLILYYKATIAMLLFFCKFVTMWVAEVHVKCLFIQNCKCKIVHTKIIYTCILPKKNVSI